MNRIGEMIERLCPKGVKKVFVGDIIEYHTGGTLTRHQVKQEGLYPVMNGGTDYSGFYDSFNYDENVLTISHWGSSASHVHRHHKKFWANNACWIFTPKKQSNCSLGYLYYILKNKENIMASKYCFGGATPNLNRQLFERIEIPLPPLTIQREIVSVLDSFTTLIDKMKQEVELRKKQMEYYREKLLSFDEEIRKLSFGKDFTLKARIGWQGLTKKEYLPDGEYKLITGTDFTTNNTIDFDHCVYVSKERYEQDPYIQIKEDDVLITKDGTLGKIAYISELPMPATLNGGVFVVRGKTGEVTQRFLKHYLISNNFKNWIEQNHTAGSIMHLTQKLLEKFNIPVPSPSTQEDIVSTLDAFEQYISKLERLITLREKQYAYYREKLLTFE